MKPWIEINITLGESTLAVRADLPAPNNLCPTVGAMAYRLRRLWKDRWMDMGLPMYDAPLCRLCHSRLSRWGWYESKDEPFRYWYCLECDMEGREPCIQIFPTEGVKEEPWAMT